MRTLTSLSALVFLFLLLPVSTYAQYESQDYLPLTKRELSRRFPITYVGTLGAERPGYFPSVSDKPVPSTINVGPSGAVVTSTGEDNVVITGKDKHQHEWRVQLDPSALYYACRFYEADLDRNGTRDALLVYPTGGNGLAPTSHLLAITFDDAGRPVTFAAEGYFQELDGQIFDVVDLNGNGRAELIYMNYDDGYWITNIYEVRNGRWRRIVGRHGNRRYPLYTRFTFKPNHKPTLPKRGRHPTAPDLSNAAN